MPPIIASFICICVIAGLFFLERDRKSVTSWALWLPTAWLPEPGWGLWTLQIGAFVAKMAFFQFLYVWVRWTLPRFRYDQLMRLGWKVMLPLAIANLAATAIVVALL